MNTGADLYNKAKHLIPGGAQLLTKRPERYAPDIWPSYYSKAKGAQVWDLDGNKYVDMTYNSVGACILGAADDDVDKAVKEAVDNGSMSTLNCPEEVELAELLIELHPWAQQVRYARCGGEAVTIAVRIIRAHTKKDKVAFCGYHGWHDWYLSANLQASDALDDHLIKGLEPLGVPKALQGTAIPFNYNNIDEFYKVVEEHGDELAGIVMEPIRSDQPKNGFLEKVRAKATELNIPLVFDEVSAGFRLTCGGSHLTLGVEPDIAVFAKGMSNGYPMGAILGKKEFMNVAWETFISSTYWTERLGPVAAIATINKHRTNKVHEHLMRLGGRVQEGWRSAAENTGLKIEAGGITPLSHFSFECEEKQPASTLFTQLMLEKGFLASPAFYPTFAHTDANVDEYLIATEEAFSVIQAALDAGNIEELLKGPVAFADFRRLA
ncbi:aminotransferase class III-fold pyridoxal phosphate-dependent enzyme [Patescibacteria group bacterium]|nr:aminotransferase class III-fold pyridoxal phosphate-dependent enzyme [Patescibacteria group bacterium]MBU1123637.1 aminotransferase class III-fold pyridoxal phosphate-dependent enzyme [Patescibacteria group bacterium]